MNVNIPAVDKNALKIEILEEMKTKNPYFFYKKKDKDTYFAYCTCCNHHGDIHKDIIKKHINDRLDTRCPICQIGVEVKRYKTERSYEQCTRTMNDKFLYTKTVKCEDNAVAFFTYKCEIDYSDNPSDERVILSDFMVTYFSKEQCLQSRCYETWDNITLFRSKNSITEPSYNSNSKVFERYYDEMNLKGTCLEHSAIEFMNIHPMEYFNWYIKNPNLEKLVKAGFSHLVITGLKKRQNFKRVINLKSDSFLGMFKNLQKIEVAEIKKTELDLLDILAYKKLKENGITHKKIDFAFDCIKSINRNFIEEVSKEKLRQLPKLLYYFEKMQKKSKDTLYLVIQDYLDYLQQLEPLNIANPDYFPSNFKLAHNRLSERIREIKRIEEEKISIPTKSKFRHLRKKSKHYKYQDGEYIVRMIDSKRELIVEGEQQNNCVAGYDKLHMKGEKCIFVIRHKSDVKKSVATVEMDMQKNAIIQCRAYKNQQVTPEVENFKKKWIDHIKKKVG